MVRSSVGKSPEQSFRGDICPLHPSAVCNRVEKILEGGKRFERSERQRESGRSGKLVNLDGPEHASSTLSSCDDSCQARK